MTGELPHKNIDTDLGLERAAILLQGVDNLYETDEVVGVLERKAQRAGIVYGEDLENGVRLRVVADRVR